MIEKAKALTNKLLGSKVFISSTFISGVYFLAGVLNFTFNLVASNILGQEQYGIVYSLISLVTIINLISAAIQLFMSKDASVLIHQGDYATLHAYYNKLLRWVFILTAVFSAGFFVAIPVIMGFLHITDTFALILILINAAVTLVYIPFLAMIQSRERFGMIAVNTILGIVVKFAVGIGLVIITVQYAGALWGILMSSVALFLFTLIDYLRYPEIKQPAGAINSVYLDNKRIVSGFFKALLSYGSFQLIIYIDSILVKHFFSDAQAGIYGTVNLLGKASFFIALALSFVLYPFMAKDRDKLHKRNRQGLFILLVVLVGYASGLALFSHFISATVFGGKYAGMEEILPLYGFMFLPYAAITFLVNFYVISEKYFYSIVILIGAVLEIIGIALFHGNLIEVTLVVGIVGYLILVALFIDSVISKRHRPENAAELESIIREELDTVE